MPYNYKIGYHSHEESDYIELQHEKKISDDELTEMIAETTIETIKKVKITGDSYSFDIHSFEDIFWHYKDIFIKYLIEKFGFKIIDYELCWSIFGWGSVFDKTDWKGDRGDHLDKITEALNKAGFTKEDDDYLRKLHGE